MKDELFIGVKSRCGLQGSCVSNSIGQPQSLVNRTTPHAGKRDCSKRIQVSSYSTLVTGEVFLFSRTIFFCLFLGQLGHILCIFGYLAFFLDF